ncbi:hypothetical protein TSTA_087980 [Talaromyces stipitatus ATCC 10500]|uniref:Uncharacterized protein n=1 Tax=Talaromyces stipitatus (strain ATCC 10500 / CBS 375.48 / QM 6759 / NRRL 1006) TaxID=441959 RepID=B8M298_TALSN|nr:uncharacterized protein TSTA_087980 [Talaromyces stipitatus ATCC 10500]EED21562.1 hypothetical protein TSTA_087980 [Talaromyces stipitatus ATCC 10500]
MVGHAIDRVTQDPDIPQEYFQEMLSWIACAERPLTLGELQTAMSTMPSSDSQVDPIDWNDWPDFETDLRTTFGSLVTLIRADGKTAETLQSGFSERKVKEYGEDEDEASVDADGASADSEELRVVDLPDFRSQ